ncbi:MAG TPA: class I SAM-dependent methyltransferase [Clostridia bacterium]|nr:class I SAM-dependent methyltransferase [Clostridia bacterium]
MHQWKKLEEPLLRFLLDKYRSRGMQSAMDFACGTGRILSVLEEYFQETIGIDVSRPMLQYALQVCPRSEIICQDITVNPIHKTVDLVTAFRFFVNAEPTLREESLKAIHTCLKPGGVLIANIHQNATSPLGLVYKIRNRIKGENIASVMSHREFSLLLDSCGFNVSETFWYSFLPRPGWWCGDLCGRLMLPCENFCRRIGIPGRFAQSFLVCALKN